MYNYRLLIQYDGTRYRGWQRLAKDKGESIQGKIENVLSTMVGEEVKIIGSGRTDAGVHALGQVANFYVSKELHPKEVKAYCNKYLPEDIRIINADVVGERFHARYNVKSKTYIYRIWLGEVMNPFLRKYCYHFPYSLNFEAVTAAIDILEGTHDFLGFSSLKNTNKSTERTLEKVELEIDNNLLEIKLTGDGFLWNMVRIIVGTLLAVGSDKMQVNEVEKIFIERQRDQAGETVPPQGLFLEKVTY